MTAGARSAPAGEETPRSAGAGGHGDRSPESRGSVGERQGHTHQERTHVTGRTGHTSEQTRLRACQTCRNPGAHSSGESTQGADEHMASVRGPDVRGAGPASVRAVEAPSRR